jgi:cation diffusion facilitator CzcD-associated flavoprotein CzcO
MVCAIPCNGDRAAIDAQHASVRWPRYVRPPIYHTADWPHESVDFGGQRVGVIGTGSSGVQAIPPIARRERELTVFQRTAAYVAPAHNGPLDPTLEARIKSDYRGFRERNRRMRVGFGSELPPNMVSALAVNAEERDARFGERWRIGGFAFLGAFYDIMVDVRANAFAAEFVRGKIHATVHDPKTALRLSPRQTIGCKRLCVDSSGYYETFNLPHVRLVDVNHQAIERITPRGVLVGGREYALDALVLATGFDAVTGTLTRLALKGRGGKPKMVGLTKDPQLANRQPA